MTSQYIFDIIIAIILIFTNVLNAINTIQIGQMQRNYVAKSATERDQAL